ncbi:CheR family methyltransferase [Bacillaceae bacterium W0354]
MRDDYENFIGLIKQKSGIDLSLYKERQMKRRLTTLRDKRGFNNFSSYFDALNSDQQLFHEFLDRMTINVSEFYRNFSRWEVLKTKILPSLLENNKTLKIWSAACSTGEEPYTLVMLLSDFLPLNRIKVFATDIDENAIQRAKLGVYPERSLKEVPIDKRQKYFTAKDNLYEISEDIKQCVTFKKHNLLLDRFDNNYDLIVCRNVLIYFTEEAKKEVYHRFSESLDEGGVLFVGSTEQIFNPAEYDFEVMQTFFYKKVTHN